MQSKLDRLAVALVSASIGFCVAMLLRDASDRFDWETLVTGCLAVAAASWTINAMRLTDAAQEKRHRQVLRLTTRLDTLRLERAADKIDEVVDTYRDTEPAAPDFSNASDPRDIVMAYGQAGVEWCNDLHALLDHPSLTDARYLFAPNDLWFYERSKTCLQNLQDWFSQIAAAPIEATAEALKALPVSGNDEWYEFSDALEETQRGVRRLAADYKADQYL